VTVATLGKLSAAKLVVIGLGDPKDLTDADVRAFAAKAARAANTEKAKSLVLGIPDALTTRYRYIGEGLELGAYRFTKYLTGDRKPKASLAKVTIVTSRNAKPAKDVGDELKTGQTVAAGVNVARDLSNEPPNVLTPAALAQSASEVAKAHHVK